MPGRRSLVGRLYAGRRFKKKQRKAVRSYKRKGDIKKTRFVRKAPVYEPKLPDRKVVSLKWSESRIMKHNGYAGYDRSTLVDINDSSTRSITSTFDDALGLFNGAAGLGQPVAVCGLPAEKYLSNASSAADVNPKYTEALQYVGTNFLDIKYPYGRPMNEWQLRCNNPMQPDPHGSIGKTYWSCLDQGAFAGDEDGIEENQYSVVPRPVVHRPYMMDNFRLHYDKFCVLAVTFDVSYQALPYDTKMSVSGSARSVILDEAKRMSSSTEVGNFWSAIPSELVGDTYDQLNQKAHTGSYLKSMDRTFKGYLRQASWPQALNPGNYVDLEGDSDPDYMDQFYRGIATNFDSQVADNDGWAWGGVINPMTGEESTAHTSVPSAAGQTARNLAAAGQIDFYVSKFTTDATSSVTGMEQVRYVLPGDGSRIIWSPRRSQTASHSWNLQVNDVIVFQVTRPGDKELRREYDAASEPVGTGKPLDGKNSTSGAVRKVYVRVTKVLTGKFHEYDSALIGNDSAEDALFHTTRLAYELQPIHRTQNNHWMDLRPQLCIHAVNPRLATIHYEVFRATFMTEDAAGGNPAQSDAFKGPGYLAFRITNEQKMEEPEFAANNWDVARIRETQPKSVKIKSLAWNDRRVHKVRLSWSLQSQKKFRPPGFTKRRRVVQPHHHDIQLNTAPEVYSSAVGNVSETVADGTTVHTSATTDQSNYSLQHANPYGSAAGLAHQHQVGYETTTSGPHPDEPVDLRSDQEKLSDLYSGRSQAGRSLEAPEVHYAEYYNPAVGQCDVMCNRDFPIEERPRFFMQYMRAHTDDAFDAKQELLQPPPIRVKVTARYRIAFMKSSEKLKHKAVGGLPDSMDYDGASDPHIRQNPCGHFVETEVDGKTALTKVTKVQTVAGQEGDGFTASGVRLSNNDIEMNAASNNLSTLSASAARAGLRILKYNRGDLLCETDRGWMLIPTIRNQSGFQNSVVHHQMGDYYKLAWKRIKNRVANKINVKPSDILVFAVFEKIFSPLRAESGISMPNYVKACVALDEEAKELFATFIKNSERPGAPTPYVHRVFENADVAMDTQESVSDPHTPPTPKKVPKPDVQEQLVRGPGAPVRRRSGDPAFDDGLGSFCFRMTGERTLHRCLGRWGMAAIQGQTVGEMQDAAVARVAGGTYAALEERERVAVEGQVSVSASGQTSTDVLMDEGQAHMNPRTGLLKE